MTLREINGKTSRRRVSNSGSRDSIVSNLLDIAQIGIDLYKESDSNPTDELLEKWFRYSEKAVELYTADFDRKISLNYSYLILSTGIDKGFTPASRLKACVDFLLEVAKIILNK